jgi:hypothetical protein
MVAVVALTSCGGDSTASGTVADTDISIETTDSNPSPSAPSSNASNA